MRGVADRFGACGKYNRVAETLTYRGARPDSPIVTQAAFGKSIFRKFSFGSQLGVKPGAEPAARVVRDRRRCSQDGGRGACISHRRAGRRNHPPSRCGLASWAEHPTVGRTPSSDPRIHLPAPGGEFHGGSSGQACPSFKAYRSTIPGGASSWSSTVQSALMNAFTAATATAGSAVAAR